MKRLLLALLCAGPSLAAVADDLALADGKVMAGVTITRAEPDGLVVMTDEGIVKVPFGNLPETTQKKFGYDPKAAAQYASAVRQAAVQRNAAQQAADTAAENAKTVDRMLDDAKSKVAAKVIGFLPDGGALVKAAFEVETVREVTALKALETGGVATPRQTQMVDNQEAVVIYGLPVTLVDGDEWNGIVFWAGKLSTGSHSYRTYAVDKADAARKLQKTMR